MMSNSQKEQIWNLLRDIQTKNRCYFRAFSSKIGLSSKDVSLLREVSAQPGITISELSDLLGLSKSTVSSMVSRLEEKQFIVREIPKDNRRIVQLRISSEFRQNPEIAQLRTQMMNGFIKELNPKDATVIINGLEKLNELICKTEIEQLNQRR
jgi:DNA-binding MarR family transcriptional regulator